MKSKLLTTLILSATALPFVAFAQDSGSDDEWSVTASAGVLVNPTYFGDDETQISAVPNVTVTYGDMFQASFQGLEYSLFRESNFKAGPVLRYDFGRDEDGSNPFSISGDDTTDLIGLGDVEGTVELGGFIQYDFGVIEAKAEIRQGLGGHEGLVGEVSLAYEQIFNIAGKPAFFSIGPQVSYGDENYNSAYFDVDAVQSAASGLAAYDSDGGFNSAGIDASLTYPLTDKVSMTFFGEYENLLGDVADSSLVQARGSESQFTGGVFLNYRF